MLLHFYTIPALFGILKQDLVLNEFNLEFRALSNDITANIFKCQCKYLAMKTFVVYMNVLRLERL